MRKIVQIHKLIKKEYPGIKISEQIVEQLVHYVDLLMKWNEKMNLTAIKREENIFAKHILDSIAFEKSDKISQLWLGVVNRRIMDLGSGAGLPGQILSIIYPDTMCVSVDKSAKKIGFQNTAKANLELTNFYPKKLNLNQIESYHEWFDSFDFVVSRAYTQLMDLLAQSARLLTLGGHAMFWKGANWQEEIQAVDPMILDCFNLREQFKYSFLSSDFGGTILLFEKTQSIS